MRTVRANGVDFAVLEEGSGPLVLLVHGFPDAAHTWDHVRPVLAAAGYRAASPFTRGYAPSSRGDGRFDGETLGRDLVALAAALDPGPAILVGHDFGAAAAYAAAALDPGRFTRLVTVGFPHPAVVRPTIPFLWKTRHFLTFQFKGAGPRLARDDFAMVDELWRRWSPGWDVPPGETAAVKACLRSPGVVEDVLAYYRAMRPQLPPPLLAKIAVPTVAFAAERDGILGLDAYQRAARRFTGPYEVIPSEAGHFLHRQRPEWFVGELLRVLGRPS